MPSKTSATDSGRDVGMTETSVSGVVAWEVWRFVDQFLSALAFTVMSVVIRHVVRATLHSLARWVGGTFRHR